MMNKKDVPTLIQSLSSFLNSSEHEDLLNQLGVSIIDTNELCSLSEGIWGEVTNNQLPYCENSWVSLLHPDDRERVKKSQEALHQGSGNVSCHVYRIRDRNGNWRWIADKNGVLLRNKDGTPWIIISIGRDLTQVKADQDAMEQKLKEADILNATTEVIMSSLNLNEIVYRILEQAKLLVPHDQATVQVLHDGFLEVLGGMGFYSMDIYKGLKFPFPEEHSLSTRAIQERCPWKSDDVTLDFPRYIQLGTDENTIRSWLGVPLIAHGDVIGLLTFDSKEVNHFNDRHLELVKSFSNSVAIALENARMHGETYQLAMRDALTGIGSRHAFNLNSKYFFEKAKREGRVLSIAMLDLDRFKRVNDDFGHLVGDQVLRDVCQSCAKWLRVTDFIARYGGEEIIILFPDTGTTIAKKTVGRICRDVSLLKFKGIDRSITLSAGIHGARITRGVRLEELIQKSDQALYESKKNGRNCITIFQAPLPEKES